MNDATRKLDIELNKDYLLVCTYTDKDNGVDFGAEYVLDFNPLPWTLEKCEMIDGQWVVEFMLSRKTRTVGYHESFPVLKKNDRSNLKKQMLRIMERLKELTRK